MVNTTRVVSSVSLWPRSMMPTLLWRRLVPVNAGTLRISHTGPLTLGQGWRWTAMSTAFYVRALISSPLRITGSYSVNFCTLYTMRCRASRRKLIYRTVKLFANRIHASITFFHFHLPVTLLSFPGYVLPHLSLAQSHEPKSSTHF